MIPRGAALAAVVTVLSLALPTGVVASADEVGPSGPAPTVSTAVKHDTSAPLRNLAARPAAATPATPEGRVATIAKPNPIQRLEAIRATNPGPPVIPDPTGPVGGAAMPEPASGFEGQPNVMGYYPPDTDGDVGPDHYVQMVNSTLAVFRKDGTPVLGPTAISTLWSGFGGKCESNDDGDPIVQYDRLADRWLVSQFAISALTDQGLVIQAPYYECVAVSATPDPTGAYHRYAFEYTAFPDYPKIGVWPDGYYVTYNMFGGAPLTFVGAKTCAWDRSAMLLGAAATEVCFDNPYPGDVPEFSLLPSDLDGTSPPPAGSANYVVGLPWTGQDSLTMYRFHVDWVAPDLSRFDGPESIPVNRFLWACLSGPCVPQRDTAVRLDGLGDRAMFRLAYRNLGSHESLLFSHTVALDDSGGANQTGIAWYEIRSPATTPVVHQQGTTADPDGITFRWMGSIAMDRQGNVAVGYSSSSTLTHPSIRYVGRRVDDPLNTLPLAEQTIIQGTGSQTGEYARWGDYSSMEVDPVDDCTFWYTNEYLRDTSTKGWRTRVASFVFPSCQVPGAPTAVDATATGTRADVTWTPPAYSGSTPVAAYTATASPGGATCTSSSTTCSLTGLQRNRAYTVTVTAANSYGPGAVSDAVAVQVPAVAPGAPVSAAAAAGTGSATVAWSPPADDGGAAVTAYTVTGSPGGSCTTTTTTCTVAGLTNGTPYTFTVTATNAVGPGPASTQTAPVTPTAVVRAQRPVHPLRLPRRVADRGWTALLSVPVLTNAGQQATVDVRCRRVDRSARSVDPRVPACRVQTRDGRLRVRLPGTGATRVVVRISAPAVAGYADYATSLRYRTRAVR